MKTLFKKIIALAVLSSFAGTLCAGTAPGPYIEGQLGKTVIGIFWDWGNQAGVGPVGWAVNGGYQFSPHFAVEGGYMGASEGFSIFDAALKGIIPVCNRFNLFGKLGAGYLASINNSHHDNGQTGPFLGVGAGYSITPNLDFNVQLSGLTWGVINVGLVSTGLSYHF